jgi:ABC-type branched-subunit amino acid transport system substrate-binding protein
MHKFMMQKFGRTFLLAGLLAMLLAAFGFGAAGCDRSLKIGVLLPLTGPDSVDSRKLLDWANQNLNENGGIAGQKLTLVYKDTASGDPVIQARELLNDKSVDVVIGPGSSLETQAIAPLFIQAKKLLISPMATSGDLFRQFGKKKFFWRTCQGDEAQVRVILQILAAKGVSRLALIAQNDTYGKTFYDWTGFYAVEYGIELLSLNQFEKGRDVSQAVFDSLAGGPEYIMVAAFSEDAVKIERKLDEYGSQAKLILTDASETQYTVDHSPEGLELVIPMADPHSGFEDAYQAEFGYYPWDTAASTYDAFLLGACTLARRAYVEQQDLQENLEDSLAALVYVSGPRVNWNEISPAVQSILAGQLPSIYGATGKLDFDKEFGVDPLQSFYGHNIIETRGGVKDFYRVEEISSSDSLKYGLLNQGASAARTQASQQFSRINQEITQALIGPKKDAWAVIVATSRGWENYRHQADALAVYDLLRSRGFSDDRILFFSVDDVPWSAQNPLPGDIHHVPGGRNLRDGAVIDYSGDRVTWENVRNVLLGNRTAETPQVLESTGESQVFLYMADHGKAKTLPFAFGPALKNPGLAELTGEMYTRGKFRQLLIMTEICFGESLGESITTPGVVYFTAAAKMESSFGATYDVEINQWLADDFTSRTLEIIQENPLISLEELYLTVYGRVIGSHVKLVNYKNFGDLNVPVNEFISP